MKNLQILLSLLILTASSSAYADLSRDEVVAFLRSHHIVEFNEVFVETLIDDLTTNAEFEKHFKAGDGGSFLRVFLGARVVDRLGDASMSPLEMKVFHGYFLQEQARVQRTGDSFVLQKLEDSAISRLFELPDQFSPYFLTNFDDLLSFEALNRFLGQDAPIVQARRMIQLTEKNLLSSPVRNLFEKYLQSRVAEPNQHILEIVEFMNHLDLMRNPRLNDQLLSVFAAVVRPESALNASNRRLFEKALEPYTADEKFLYSAFKRGIPKSTIEQILYLARASEPGGSPFPLDEFFLSIQKVVPLNFTPGKVDETSAYILEKFLKRMQREIPNVGWQLYTKVLRENPTIAKKYASKIFLTEFASLLDNPLPWLDSEQLFSVMTESLTPAELARFYALAENQIADSNYRRQERNALNNRLLYEYAPKGTYFWFEKRILEIQSTHDWSPILDELNSYLQELATTRDAFNSHRRLFALIGSAEGMPDITALRLFRMYLNDIEYALKHNLVKVGVANKIFQTVSSRIELRFFGIEGYSEAVAKPANRIRRLLCGGLYELQFQ